MPQEELCPRRQLCGALAAAVVTHSAPPSNIVPPAGVSTFALALAGDDPGTLVHLPVMEHGRLLTSPLEPAGSLSADSAAWAAYEAAGSAAAGRQAGLPLVWRGGSGSEPPAYPDWRALLDSESSEGSPPPTALVTVPIVGPGSTAPLGAATFALQDAPSQQQVEELAHLGACLACSISHQTKNLWEVSAVCLAGREDSSLWGVRGRFWAPGWTGMWAAAIVHTRLPGALHQPQTHSLCTPPCCTHLPSLLPQESLGFLNTVIPRRVVQRMLSAALSLGPLAAAPLPPPGAAAAAAAAVVAEAAAADLPASAPGTPAWGGGGAKRRWAAPNTPLTPLSSSGGWTPRSLLGPAEPAEPAGPAALAPANQLPPYAASPAAAAEPRAIAPPAEPCPERLAFGAEPAVAAEIKTLRQKWNLEFADPLLEERWAASACWQG